MRSIWKFGLTEGMTTVSAKVIKWLNVGYDPSGNICVWAIVDPEALNADNYTILQIGTGWGIQEDEKDLCRMKFIGSIKEGPYMWHYFVDENEKEELENFYDYDNDENNYDYSHMTVNFGGMTLG